MCHMGTPSRTVFFRSPGTPCWTVFLLLPPLFIGEVDRASAPPMLETEGSWCVYTDPSVIRQDRAVTPMRASHNDTSPTSQGRQKTKLEVRA
jgi:hypothetical protein